MAVICFLILNSIAYSDTSHVALAWGVQYEQEVMFWREAENKLTPAHPYFNFNRPKDFKSNCKDCLKFPEFYQTWNYIAPIAIDEAYQRGIREIDLFYYADETSYKNKSNKMGNQSSQIDSTDLKVKFKRIYNHLGLGWVKAVDHYNSSLPSNAEKIKLKVRVRASVIHLAQVAQFISDANLSDNFHDYCALKRDGKPAMVLDLSLQEVKTSIYQWTDEIIKSIKRNVKHTEIQAVLLSIDEGAESSIQSGLEILGFKETGLYPAKGSYTDKVKFFLRREKIIIETWKAFSDAVRENGLKSMVIYSGEVLTDYQRGIWDLYSSLKKANIDYFLHTHLPTNYQFNLKGISINSTPARFLKIPFETEFTWAHWKVGKGSSYIWKPGSYYKESADQFYAQAKAGINYGATGISYTNWTMQEFINPPSSDDSTFNEAWRKLLGGQNASEDHLYDSTGLLNPKATFTFNDSARYAIYISNLGKIQCQLKSYDAKENQDGAACDWLTYLRWFKDFGLDKTKPSPLEKGKIDILTDGMILDSIVNWSQYHSIFVPYETSMVTDKNVVIFLNNLSADLKSKFKYQNSAKKSINKGYAKLQDWTGQTSFMEIKID